MSVPLSIANLNAPPSAAEWFAASIANLATLGLPTTSFQQGSVERTLLTSESMLQQQSDVAASICVQAGFLRFASSGYVTYTAADGTVITEFVTPDPSVPAQNPDGALGWLDVLADGLYDERRVLTAPAGGTIAILNTSATTYGPFAIGAYHVAQATGEGYSNTASLSIPQSTTVASVSNVTSSGGLVRITTSSAHGLSTDDVIAIAGVVGITPLSGTTAWVITVTSSTQFTLNGSTFAGSYVSGGTVYTPTLAGFTADVSGSTSSAAPNEITVSTTSLIGVSVANYDDWIGTDTESNSALETRCILKLAAIAVGAPGGQVAYYALRARALAPELDPPQALAAEITRVRVDLDTLTGTVYATIANQGGAPIGSDVIATQAVLDAYVGITAFTIIARAAVNKTITVALTVYLPASYNSTANHDLFVSAVETYFRALTIAGNTMTGGTSPTTNVVPYESVLGAVFVAASAASIPLREGDVQGTINGARVNVALALSPVPEVAVPSITITLTSL